MTCLSAMSAIIKRSYPLTKNEHTLDSVFGLR